MIHHLHFENAMFIVSTVLVFFTLNLLFGISTGLSLLANSVQRVCVSTLPHSAFYNLSAAITCGISINNGSDKNAFIQTGLIHLVVVSGSHFVIFDQLLDKIHLKNQMLRLIIFGVFALASGLEPPALRAFITISLRSVARNMSSFASPLQINFFSGILCIYIFPHWWNSLSFHLSWICALALSLTITVFKKPSVLLINVMIFTLLAPVLLIFGQIYPLSLFWNVMVGPIVGGLLFPLNLVTIICPPVSFLTDWLWKMLILLCSTFEQPSLSLSTVLNKNSLLLFSLISQTFFFVLIVYSERKNIKKKQL